MDTLEFISEISWPIVALIGFIILGPGGVLKSIVGELSDKLLHISTEVKKFQQTAESFEQAQKKLSSSTDWVEQLGDQLSSINKQIETIRGLATDSAITEGNRSLSEVEEDVDTQAADSPVEELESADEMFDSIYEAWTDLTEKLRERVGYENFDGRSIGQMAWKLNDGRRSSPLSQSEAELFENLHTQWKRFTRLQSSKEEWLTHDVYATFIRGIEKACNAI